MKTTATRQPSADELAALDTAYQERVKSAVRPIVQSDGKPPLLEQLSGLRSIPAPALPSPKDDPEVQRLSAERDRLRRELAALDKEQERRNDQLIGMGDSAHRMTARREIVRLAEQAEELRPKMQEIEQKLAARQRDLKSIREQIVNETAAQLAALTLSALELLVETAQSAEALGRASGRWHPGQGPAFGIPARPELYKAYVESIRRRIT